MSAAAGLAGVAGICAVLAAWEAIAAAEQQRLAGWAARWLAPALDALRSCREPTSPERRRLVLVAALSLVGGGCLLAGPLAGLALGAAAPSLARVVLRARRARRRAAIAAQAPAIARALADALAGGHSVRGALGAAAHGSGVRGPAGDELRVVAGALELGERTEDVLREFARRAGPGPCDTLAAAILLQRDAGGDLAGLLRSLAVALEVRGRVVAEARSATAQARFTALLVIGLPFAGLALGELVQPGYLVTLAASPLRARADLRGDRPADRGVRLRAADRARGGAGVTALLAALGGICAAAAIVELAASGSARPPRRRGPARAARLGAVTVLLARAARRRRGARRRLPTCARAARGRRRAAGADRPPTSWRSRPPAPSAARCSRVAADRRAAGPPRARGAAVRARRRLPGARPRAREAHAGARGAHEPRARRRARPAARGDRRPACRSGRALAEVGRRCSGPLANELRATAARVELGAARERALAQLVERCPLEGVAALAAAIARADRHGAPLAPALEAIVADARAEQARRLRDDAARAAPKIQLVVALVLVPAVMLLVAAVLVQALA